MSLGKECFGWSKGRQRASSDAWVLFTQGSCEKREQVAIRILSNVSVILTLIN